jgi:hypothetical protein
VPPRPAGLLHYRRFYGAGHQGGARLHDNLVLNNQVICGTVNAGRAAFEEGVQDLASFVERFPAALNAMITARVTLDDARDAVLARGGIKTVIAVA